jgi:acyl-CoA:acyl-CoA alkyltransferase
LRQFEKVSIQGLAYVDAPHRVTSAELSGRLSPVLQRFGLRPDLLESLTGITARRFWDPGVQPSTVAAMAGERALEQAGIGREQVGVLISTSVCKDYIEPSVASLVHHKLKLRAECLNFDLGNACLAFLDAMTVAGNMIERGQVDYALIVDGEGSRYINEVTIERLNREETTPQQFRDNFATLTLGSGAVASPPPSTAGSAAVSPTR